MKPDSKLKRVGGIYRIRNKSNGKIYIGRTKCFYRRCRQYLYDFENSRIDHINSYLLGSMKKYGLESFDFEVVERCSFSESPQRELHWILKTKSNETGYNLRLDVDGAMVVHVKTRLLISDRLKKEWASGVRDQHSNKLKRAWEKRDRKEQARTMSKAITRYRYTVDGRIIDGHKELLALGLSNVFSNFHRRKTNDVTHKGRRVVREVIK